LTPRHPTATLASMIDPAVVLLAHGSPDPDWMAPVHRTAEALRSRMPEHAVVVATLGGDHDTALESAVDNLIAAGHARIVVTAVFLSPGGRHVKRDIPERVAQLQTRYGSERIELVAGALGDDPAVAEALAGAAERAVLGLS